MLECITGGFGSSSVVTDSVLVFGAGSTSSSLCDHWINRLPGSRPASLASGASSRRTSLASLAESVEFPGERSEDDGENNFSLFSPLYSKARAPGKELSLERSFRKKHRFFTRCFTEKEVAKVISDVALLKSLNELNSQMLTLQIHHSKKCFAAKSST